MRKKFIIGFITIVFLLWAGNHLVRMIITQAPSQSGTPDWDDLPDPLPKPTPKPVPAPDIEASFDNLDDDLRKLLKRFGAPPLPASYPSDISINVKPSEGLSIVETILHSSVADDFVGRFDRGAIFPGTIIDCMPFVRADLNHPVRSLAGLYRNPYKVVLSTYVGSSPENTEDRLNWDLPEGRQDIQSQIVLSQVYPELNVQADNLNSPTRFRRSARFARTYQEAQAKLGFSLNNPFVNVQIDSSTQSRSDRGVFLGMVQQEFFRLLASPLPREGEIGPNVWLPSNESNVQVLEGLAPSDTLMPGVPALIREVRYGRVIIVAFEVDWNENNDELEVHVDGNYGSTSASIDAWTSAIQRSRSGAVDIIVYGGGPVPELPSGVSVVSNDEDSTQRFMINTESAVQAIDAILKAGSDWSSSQPGLPIGITFELLDDASTQLKPMNTSLVELARAARPNGGWKIQLDCDVRNDYDADSFWTGRDSGDWRFWFRQNSDELVFFDHDVTASTSFTFTRDLSRPVVWDERIGGFSIEIIEDDDGLRGGDDGDKFEIAGEIELHKPSAYTAFEDAIPDAERKVDRLSRKFRETLKLDNASSDTNSFQSKAHMEWKSRRIELENLTSEVRETLDELERLRQAAETALRAIQNNGAGSLEHSAAGNKYTIIAKPDMRSYIRYLRAITNTFEDSWRSVRDYLDE